MKKVFTLTTLLLVLASNCIFAQHFKMSKEELKDKIKGAWAMQTVGVTFGGPTEFVYKSTFIHDYTPIDWSEDNLKWWFENEPGLYDDIFMDLTFVDIIEKKGIDAPASDFAIAFANAGYELWHANQAARYNILNGIMPPESGHWLNNPHADDIDYQIEADFSGIMNPGMPASVAEIGDKVGHIMNYGDGWYGGIYIGTMYSLAFISDDVNYVVEESLKSIPEESRFYKVISDVIKWHKENPNDWKWTWFNVQKKWGEDIGCPEGVFSTFNIDAVINSSWVVLGLLYGEGDFDKTISISTRAGDDSDCNPASAAGILATITGFSKVPAYWKQGLDKVESINFKYTSISLNDVYGLSYKHALQMIERNGGTVGENEVTIKTQPVEPVKLEVGFKDHFPVERKKIFTEVESEYSFEFEGIGFAVMGSADNLIIDKILSGIDEPEERHNAYRSEKNQYVFEAELYIDGKLVNTSKIPTDYLIRKNTLFWKYQLEKGKHSVRIKILNPTDPDHFKLNLNYAVIYSDSYNK